MGIVRLLLLAIAMLGAGTLGAAAQSSFPNHPIRILVGFPPGTASDTAARLIGLKLVDLAGQNVIIENKPGASSNIAAEAVVRAPADGYTLFLGTIANTINASMLPDQRVDFSTDFSPVALVSTVPNLLVVHPSLTVATVGELVTLAKARPAKLTYGSSGTGTIPHLSAELFASMAGIKLLHVPYKGSSQAMADLLGGQIAMMFAPVSTALAHVRSGAVRALAVTSAKREAVAPEVPTMAELGFDGYETGVWTGLLAPPETPFKVVDRLAALVAQAQDSPELQAQFAAQGMDVMRGGPSVFAQYIATEIDKWSRVMKASGVRSD
jgi:tripartite-type tricarboxylate transporter receptor subunit TctC